jgi:DNA-binding transcriptional ArsR family regulator
MSKKLPLADAALLFNLLGDRTRLRILLLLSRRGEMGIGELSEAVGIRSVGVSYHLAKLRLHGFIDGRRRGQRRSYTLGAGLVHDPLREARAPATPWRFSDGRGWPRAQDGRGAPAEGHAAAVGDPLHDPRNPGPETQPRAPPPGG